MFSLAYQFKVNLSLNNLKLVGPSRYSSPCPHKTPVFTILS